MEKGIVEPIYELKPSVKMTKAKVKVVAGGKEQRGIIRSAEVIHKAIPGSELVIKEGLYHGERSINHSNDYVKTVRKMLL